MPERGVQHPSLGGSPRLDHLLLEGEASAGPLGELRACLSCGYLADHRAVTVGRYGWKQMSP